MAFIMSFVCYVCVSVNGMGLCSVFDVAYIFVKCSFVGLFVCVLLDFVSKLWCDEFSIKKNCG